MTALTLTGPLPLRTFAILGATFLIAATPGTKAYGALSVKIAYYSQAEVAGSVPREVFGRRTGAGDHPRRRRREPRAVLHGQVHCAADQDAVDHGQRPGDSQELIPRRAGHSA